MSEYSIHITYVLDDGEPHYVARHPELSCCAHGATVGEALKALEFTRNELLEDLAREGLPIPEPSVIIAETGSQITLSADPTMFEELS